MMTTYWRVVLAVVPIVGTVIATLAFLLRLYSRLLMNKKFDIGDFLMSLGLFISYGVTICTILAAFSGVGNDIWGLQLKYDGRVIMLFWLTQSFWALSQTFIKLSVTLLLRNLLASIRKWQITTTALFIYTVAWGIVAILVNIFQCWPIQHFWLPSTHGACINGQTSFFISIGALSLTQDVVLLLLPIAVIWRLRLSIRQKVQITVLFSMGGLVCVFSLLRLVAFKNYIKNNATSSGSKEALWTLLELDLAIVCTSLVLMRPFFHKCARVCKDYPCTVCSRIYIRSGSSVFTKILQHWQAQIICSDDICLPEESAVVNSSSSPETTSCETDIPRL